MLLQVGHVQKNHILLAIFTPTNLYAEGPSYYSSIYGLSSTENLDMFQFRTGHGIVGQASPSPTRLPYIWFRLCFQDLGLGMA